MKNKYLVYGLSGVLGAFLLGALVFFGGAASDSFQGKLFLGEKVQVVESAERTKLQDLYEYRDSLLATMKAEKNAKVYAELKKQVAQVQSQIKELEASTDVVLPTTGEDIDTTEEIRINGAESYNDVTLPTTGEDVDTTEEIRTDEDDVPVNFQPQSVYEVDDSVDE